MDDFAASWLRSIAAVSVDTWLGILGGATAVGGIAQGFMPRRKRTTCTIIIIVIASSLMFSGIVVYRHREYQQRIDFLAQKLLQKLGTDRISFLQIGRIISDYDPSPEEINEVVSKLKKSGTLKTIETLPYDQTFGKNFPILVYFTN